MIDKIPTLYSNYNELLLDFNIYCKTASIPQLDISEKRDMLFEEFKRQNPLPTMEIERYKLSNLISTDYKVTYEKQLELQENENLIDLENQSDSHSIDLDIDFESLEVPDNIQGLFTYEEGITDSDRQAILEKFDLLSGEEFDLGSSKAEEVYNTVQHDDTSTLTDEQIQGMINPDVSQPPDTEPSSIEIDEGISVEEYDSDTDDSEITEVKEDLDDSADSDTEYEEDLDSDDDEDTEEEVEEDDEDTEIEYEDSDDNLEEVEEDDTEAEYEDSDDDEDTEIEYEDDDSDEDDLEEVEDNSLDSEPQVLEEPQVAQAASPSMQSQGTSPQTSEPKPQVSQPTDIDEDDDEDIEYEVEEYEDDDEDIEEEEIDEEEPAQTQVQPTSTSTPPPQVDSEDTDDEDIEEEYEEDEEYEEVEEDEESDEEYEEVEQPQSSQVAQAVSQTQSSSPQTASPSSQTQGISHKPESTQVTQNSPSFVDSILDEPTNEDDIEFIAEENRNKVIETPKIQLQPVQVQEEPKKKYTDLRQFLRAHPRCEYSEALKYFSDKEIKDMIRKGKVIKKGTTLRI